MVNGFRLASGEIINNFLRPVLGRREFAVAPGGVVASEYRRADEYQCCERSDAGCMHGPISFLNMLETAMVAGKYRHDCRSRKQPAWDRK
jgi:hypothetical protein